MKSSSKFDIVVYGATGFTGQLVCEYLAAHYKGESGLKWAMAGRSLDKLKSVRDAIGAPADTPLIPADSSDVGSLKAKVEQTRSVLTTVGPYQWYGNELIAACAASGTDYLDLCGEPVWMRQMIILINGLQYTGYRKFEWGVVGETACADSWGRALKTREPSLSLPCFAERRYGGVPDEEMLMALPPAHLAKAIVGMKQLAKNGLRYPIAPYGIQADVRAGMGVSYGKK